MPGQGSTHFWLTQALSKAHSELIRHSGRQAGGVPMNPITQEQTACLFTSRQILFGPHGDGLHGSTGVGVAKIITVFTRFVQRNISVR